MCLPVDPALFAFVEAAYGNENRDQRGTALQTHSSRILVFNHNCTGPPPPPPQQILLRMLNRRFQPRLFMVFFFILTDIFGAEIWRRAEAPPPQYSALLWQKEATGKSPESEKVMFLDWTYTILLVYQVWIRNIQPAERYLSQVIPILRWCQCTWQTHFAHLRKNFIFKSCFLLSLYGSIIMVQNSPIQLGLKVEPWFGSPQLLGSYHWLGC